MGGGGGHPGSKEVGNINPKANQNFITMIVPEVMLHTSNTPACVPDFQFLPKDLPAAAGNPTYRVVVRLKWGTEK